MLRPRKPEVALLRPQRGLKLENSKMLSPKKTDIPIRTSGTFRNNIDAKLRFLNFAGKGHPNNVRWIVRGAQHCGGNQNNLEPFYRKDVFFLGKQEESITYADPCTDPLWRCRKDLAPQTFR